MITFFLALFDKIEAVLNPGRYYRRSNHISYYTVVKSAK